MKRSWGLNSRGISTVISAIMLSAVVLAVGGAVWFYSQSASTSIAKDYVEGVTTLMNDVTERFTVEHVSYVKTSKNLTVWIYNYGGIDVIVDVYVNVEGGVFVRNLEKPLASNSLIGVNLSLDASSGSEVAIKVVSRRGNNAYYTYIMP